MRVREVGVMMRQESEKSNDTDPLRFRRNFRYEKYTMK